MPSTAGDRSSKIFTIEETKKRTKRDSTMTMASTHSKMLPDGTKLGRPINNVRYVKGSIEEKDAQMEWVKQEMRTIGIA